MWGDFRHAARRFSENAKAAVDDTVSEFYERGFTGVVRDTVSDASDAFKEIADTTKDALSGVAQDAKEGFNFLVGGDSPAEGVNVPRGATWQPPVALAPPRLEDLRKGDKVFRKGEPAEVVKMDYEVDPPALVVRMLDDGREIGTIGPKVSLGIEASQRCLKAGVRCILVGLKNRQELNGEKAVVVGFKADVARWNVQLASDDAILAVKPENISVQLANVEDEPQAPLEEPEASPDSASRFEASPSPEDLQGL